MTKIDTASSTSDKLSSSRLMTTQPQKLICSNAMFRLKTFYEDKWSLKASELNTQSMNSIPSSYFAPLLANWQSRRLVARPIHSVVDTLQTVVVESTLIRSSMNNQSPSFVA